MSSQVPPQQSVPAARAPVLQPCPGQTLCPVSCLGKDESTGVHPVLLGCTLALWDGPCPVGVRPLPASTHDGHFFSAQGGEWSLAALLRGKVVPDCVGGTPAPLLPQRRAPETIHICHGNHGRGSASWALPSPSRHPDPPAPGPTRLLRQRVRAVPAGGRRQDRQTLGVPCSASHPPHLWLLLLLSPGSHGEFDGRYRDSRPGDLAAEGQVPAAQAV